MINEELGDVIKSTWEKKVNLNRKSVNYLDHEVEK